MTIEQLQEHKKELVMGITDLLAGFEHRFPGIVVAGIEVLRVDITTMSSPVRSKLAGVHLKVLVS